MGHEVSGLPRRSCCYVKTGILKQFEILPACHQLASSWVLSEMMFGELRLFTYFKLLSLQGQRMLDKLIYNLVSLSSHSSFLMMMT